MSLLIANRESIAFVQSESRITNDGLFHKSTRSENKLKLGSKGVRILILMDHSILKEKTLIV